MTILKLQASMQMFTNLPEDVVTNTWHFITDDIDPPEDAADLAASRLSSFYGTALNGCVANYITGSTMRVKGWDLSDPEPRATILDGTISPVWGTKGTSILPTELACVLSFHATPISGVPQARRRNRIYLGGFDDTAMVASSTSNFPMINPVMVNSIVAAAETLLAANDGGLSWCGLSKATGLPTTFSIAGGWVDNSPDTQRRRGINASSRTLWP